jgi:hypothetical protein
MKKHKRGGREPIEEIISLNDELFSLVNGDPLAMLDERLAIAAGDGGICNGYTCGALSGCTGYSCATFKIP